MAEFTTCEMTICIDQWKYPSWGHQKPQIHKLVQIFAVAGEIVTYVKEYLSIWEVKSIREYNEKESMSIEKIYD